MASPQSGTAGTIVPPAAPEVAHDADNADPGEVEKVKVAERVSHTGKYGSQPITPYKPPKTSEEAQRKTSWIEIVLIDKTRRPVPGAKYTVKLPDGAVAQGTLDAAGFARINAIEPGNCEITFPEYAPNSWDRA